jgi:hypothetical protein
MGWLFSRRWETKADLIRHLTGPGYGGERLRCARHALRGNVLWTVHERRADDGTTRRFIGCFLLAKERDAGWGYKDMDESMGPCFHSCPLGYLDDVPCPDSGHAREWRGRVRERHALDKAVIPVGHYVQVGDRCMRVVSTRPLRATFGGVTYRLPRRYIKRVVLPAEYDAELAATAAAGGASAREAGDGS